MREFGGIDLLVNNAAYQMAQPGGIADITTEQFDRVVKTNLYAMFWLCKKALPHMPPGSRSSTPPRSRRHHPRRSCWTTRRRKAAIVNFTRGLAADASPSSGIRVNAVAPGPIWTPLIPATMPRGQVDVLRRGRPRWAGPGQPAELAPAYVFLASQESSYITGEVVAVTGGMPVSV